MTMQDPIELLLPEADESQLELARRVTTLARLVVDDARPKLAQSDRLDLASAREELERDQAERLTRAMDSLLSSYMTQEVSEGESFLWFESGELEFHEAWTVLLEARAERKDLPGVPVPTSSSLAIARQLCHALESLRAGNGAEQTSALWRAVIRALEDGPHAGEAAFRSLLDQQEGSQMRAQTGAQTRASHLESRLVAHIAECLLDRGAVREAWFWLQERRSLFCESARLEQLSDWCSCLTSQDLPREVAGAGAQKTDDRASTSIAPLPPRLQRLFSGWKPSSPASAESEIPAPIHVRESSASDKGPGLSSRLGRAEFGLSCLAVFGLDDVGLASALHVDAAPGLQGRLEDWLKGRSDACAVASDPQQLLFVCAEEVISHRPEELSRAALGGEGTLALALTPIRDPSGEVAGWISMECEHHLLPSREVRARFAESWRDDVLRRRSDSAGEDSDLPLHATLATSEAERPPSFTERATHPRSGLVFEQILGEFGLGLSHRRAHGFDVLEGRPTCVHESGLALTSEEPGGRRALRRALQSGGAVLFEEPDLRLSLHARSASGVVVPVHSGEQLIGLLSLESTRRRDLNRREIERLYAIANDRGRSLFCAQFADAHAETHGFGPYFEAERADFGEFFDRALRAAKSSRSLVLAGPRGCGKRVLARLLSKLAHCAEPVEWTVAAADLEASPERFIESLISFCGETLMLDGVEDLGATSQARLLRAIEQAGPSAPRLWTRLQAPLAEGVSQDRIDPELALRLGCLELTLPSLAQRREEIPGLARSLLAHLAEMEGCATPELDDQAAALLWRQPWRGNIRELESVLARALHEAGEVLRPEHLESGTRLEAYLPRIPSRSPSRSDLVSALWTTRKRNGRGNRRRAALYLGWDPETLARRCSESDVPLDTPEPPTPWLNPT